MAALVLTGVFAPGPQKSVTQLLAALGRLGRRLDLVGCSLDQGVAFAVHVNGAVEARTVFKTDAWCRDAPFYPRAFAHHHLLGGHQIAIHAPIDINGVRIDISLDFALRSEEHTSELQSRGHLVCRLLLEKKNNIKLYDHTR